MKKLLLSLLISFFISSFCYSEVSLKLKTGKVVKGEVVEETQDYIKIKTQGISLTYWFDEIEEIIGGSKQRSSSELARVYMAYLKGLEKDDWQEMKKYLAKDKAVEIDETEDLDKALAALRFIMARDIEVVEESIGTDTATLILKGKMGIDGEGRGVINFVKEGNDWKMTEENWHSKVSLSSQSSLSTDVRGDGIVSGTITLPDVSKEGHLYIILAPAGQIVRKPDSVAPYVVIGKDKITSSVVPYTIKNVPAGTYWAFATWDTADPFWDPSWGKGNCPAYGGDYTGGSGEEIVISDDEIVKGIDFKCQNYIRPVE